MLNLVDVDCSKATSVQWVHWVSSSSSSRVGVMEIRAEQYVSYGHSCSECEESRYLACVNESCQCPPRTYFAGSICESAKLLGDECSNSSECRTDLNLTCLPRLQCGLRSIQAAQLIAGKAGGGSGSGLSQLSGATGTYLGKDNSIYVADYENARIMKYVIGRLNGSLVAGTGTSGFTLGQLNRPTSVYVDASSNLYIADSFNYRIMYWQRNATSGSVVAGSGSLGNTSSSFGVVNDLTVDSQGNVYISDRSNHRIMKFAPNVSSGVVVGGITGYPGNAANQLNQPAGIFIDELNSYLYVSDCNNHRIQRFEVGVSTNGSTVAGGNGGGAASNQLLNPQNIFVSRVTNGIYIADSGNNRVQRWHFQSTFGVPIAGKGTAYLANSTSLSSPWSVRLDVNETSLFVSEFAANRVWRFHTCLTYLNKENFHNVFSELFFSFFSFAFSMVSLENTIQFLYL